jgi:eukaryotic-like serine/threonine-protein kinase
MSGATRSPETAAVASARLTSPKVTSPLASKPPTLSGKAEFGRGPTELADDALIGHEIVGRYHVLKKLGQGGMGTVYLATHKALEKQVALKVLHGEFARKPDLVERFMQEAKSASKIRHEHVIDISDFGTTPDGLVFFAMELLNGRDLHEDIQKARNEGGVLPWERAKKIFLQVCAALSAAHKLGIVHRDLKPENVYLVDFLGDRDFVKLLDFGIAKLTELNEGERKLTRTGMLFGTPEYMSPEQARGEKIDARVDVYSMGCILYQLVTGHVPFSGDNFMGVLTQHLTETPPPIAPEIFDQGGSPRALANVISTALMKDRKERFQTIDELANAVRTAAGDAPLAKSAEIPATRPITGQNMRRHPTPVGLATQPTAAPDTAAALGTTPPESKRSTLAPMIKSKLPMIIGASVIFLAGVGTTIWWLSRSAPESQPAAAPTPIAEPTPPPPPPKVEPAPLPPLPDQVVIHLDSKPHGAKITDVASQRTLGKTPLTFRLAGSREPRQFGLTLRGYGDAVIELVPNRERIEYTEELEKGAVAHVARVPDPTKPAAGSAATPTPAEAGSGEGSNEEDGSAAAGSASKPGMALPSTGETKPAETKPTATTKPAEIKPATTTKPAETKPTTTKPATTTTKAADTKPSTTTKPAESKPAATKPSETKPATTTKATETKPAEAKPTTTK